MFILGILLLGLALANGARIRRVVGGSEAISHEFPYQGSLYIQSSRAKAFICSGSIIHENWILTSANCVANRTDISNMWFGAGLHSLIGPVDRYKVFSIIIHPDYKYDPVYGASIEGDIALVQIDGSIRFNEQVKKIALPSSGEFKDYNASADFAGWGRKSVNGEYPDRLQKIKLNLISNEECEKSWSRITEKQVCTFTKAGEGVCGTDSGSPLVVDGYQVGIASYNKPCALGIPDVFTRISSYVNWIKETQKKHSYIVFTIWEKLPST